MRIAITLLTCDRSDYTARTLQTLCRHNDLSSFILLHGDDASHDMAGAESAGDCGFETVVQTQRRAGVARMTELLFDQAKRREATHVLNLQNDWECMRPIPLAEIEQIFADPRVYCLRLYGRLKSHHGRCGIHHGGRTPRLVVDWRPYMPGYEWGEIHWGHPPAITRIGRALALTKSADCESVSRIRSGALNDLTVRPIENNVFSHIGAIRTPGFAS